jgi:hypothetical protein
MGVASDDNFGVVQTESRFKGADDIGRLESPVGVEYEATRLCTRSDHAATGRTQSMRYNRDSPRPQAVSRLAPATPANAHSGRQRALCTPHTAPLRLASSGR